MGFQVVFTKPALRDIEALIAFIARDNPTAAEQFGYELVDKTDILLVHPFLGRIVPEFKIETIRELIHRPYRIIYRINGKKERIEILRIWHAARGIPRLND